MPLTVRHLNGDTTFLLTFTPEQTPVTTSTTNQDNKSQSKDEFRILLDPWLSGPSQMWHPKFLTSKHTTPCSIKDLSEIPDPHLVLISQAKPDHCHEATLRQLDPDSPITTILAEPGAAKRIRGMKHFHPDSVHSLRSFSPRNPESIIRFCIPSSDPDRSPGEAAVTFVPAKLDVAGVHTAIAITYKPPGASKANIRSEQSHDSRLIASAPLTPPESPIAPHYNMSAGASTQSSTPQSATFSQPSSTSSQNSISTSSSNVRPSLRSSSTKPISVIYSPHGVDYELLKPYVTAHLIKNAALPLTLLLHSFDRVNNPWWMGGNVAAGSTGGAEIARNLMARCWISAHDEEKENTGISVANVKVKKFSTDDVSKMIDAGGGVTRVLSLPVGGVEILTA